MRSTNFVILSLLIHGCCVVVLILAPTRTISADKEEKIDVTLGEPEPPAPQVKTAAPMVKKTVVAQVKVHHSVAAPAVEPEAAPVPAVTSAPAEADQASDEPPQQQEEKEVFVPVKETPPAGVEAADSDEDTQDTPPAEDSSEQEEPASTPDSAVVPTPAPAPVAPKGGVSKDQAVSYLTLKQMPGNQPPTYPMTARLEKRQGKTLLLYRVTKDGKVTDIQVAKSSGSKDLDNEAVHAIAQFRFQPGQEGWARHSVNFTLKGPVAVLPSQLRGTGAQND